MTAEHTHDLPKPLLVSAGLLILLAISLVIVGDDLPQTATLSTDIVVSSHDIRLHTLEDGAILPVLTDGTRLTAIKAEKAGFVSGVMRGLSRGRKLAGSDPDAPYRLSRLRDGRLLLTDTATGTTINLDVFGTDNAKTFAALWEQGEAHTGGAPR
ncbi:MAG: photosynthetic complex assembly protein PuhC [Nevskiaceae bacterium]